MSDKVKGALESGKALKALQRYGMKQRRLFYRDALAAALKADAK